jgi:hypothetical protein
MNYQSLAMKYVARARNFLNHDTPAGSYLWGKVYWRRRTAPVNEVFIPLTKLPQFLQGEKVETVTVKQG